MTNIFFFLTFLHYGLKQYLPKEMSWARHLKESSKPGPLSSRHFIWILSDHGLKEKNMISCLKLLFFNGM